MATFPVSLTVDNPGAETCDVGGLVGGNWTSQFTQKFGGVGSGTNALTAGADTPSPRSGNNCFVVNQSSSTECWMYQDISVPSTDGLHTDVDVGDILAELTVYINGPGAASFHPADSVQIGLEMFDSGASATVLDWSGHVSQPAVEPGESQTWRQIKLVVPVPTDTRTIRLHVRGLDGATTGVLCYLDDFALRLIEGTDVYHYLANLTTTVGNWTAVSGTLIEEATAFGESQLSIQSGGSARQDVGSFTAGQQTAIDADEMVLDMRWEWSNNFATDTAYLQVEFLDGSSSVLETIKTDDSGQVSSQNDSGFPMAAYLTYPVPASTRTIRVTYAANLLVGGTANCGPIDIHVAMRELSAGRAASQIEFDIATATVSSGASADTDVVFSNLSGHDIEAIIVFYNRATADATAATDGALGVAFARRSNASGYSFLEMQDLDTSSTRTRRGQVHDDTGSTLLRLTDGSALAMELTVTFGEGKVTLTPDATDNDVDVGLTVIGIAAENPSTDIEGDVYRRYMGSTNGIWDQGIAQGFAPTIDLVSTVFLGASATESGGDGFFNLGFQAQQGAPRNLSHFQNDGSNNMWQGGVYGAFASVIDASTAKLDASRQGYMTSSGIDAVNIMDGAAGGFSDMFEHHLALRLGNLRSKIIEFNTPTSTGNNAVTGLGFEPGLVIMFTMNDASLVTSLGSVVNAVDAWCHGMFTANEEACRGGHSSGPSADSHSYRNATALSLYEDDTGSPLFEASFVSMDSDGFTLNFTTVDASAYPVVCLCVEAGSALTDSATPGGGTGTRPVLIIGT